MNPDDRERSGRRELVYDPISDRFIELVSDAANDENDPPGQPS